MPTAHVRLDQRGQCAAIGAGLHDGKLTPLGVLTDRCLNWFVAGDTKKVPSDVNSGVASFFAAWWKYPNGCKFRRKRLPDLSNQRRPCANRGERRQTQEESR
jgi:hypothetical protein